MPRRAVHMVSLGCAKNRVDSEVMLGLLVEAGLRPVEDPAEAEVILVNTCGFIGDAKAESVDAILEMARQKQEGRCRRLVVTGCLVQRHPEELARELPEVDAFLGAADLAGVVAAVDGEARLIQVAEKPRWLYDDTMPRLPSMGHLAYVKIAEGCDRPCSFCIIPALRGEQRSRTVDSVEREVRRLLDSGVVEINLVAQDTTAYGADLGPGGPSLTTLLRRLAPIDGLGWLRVHYTYPTAITDELLDTIAEQPTIVKYIDVPLQHIDDRILRLMRRGHTGRAARSLVERIRRRVPGVALRTTLIVGHPGEDEESFARLREFVEEGEIDHLGVFAFSREDGTHSATLTEEAVAGSVAEKRRRELMRLQRKLSRRRLRRRVGEELTVMVDGPSGESEYLLEGRHGGQAPEVDGRVFLGLGESVKSPRAGDLVRARIDSASDYDLAATALEVVRRAARRKRLPVIS